MFRESAAEMRVIILAPVGRDASLIQATLRNSEIESAIAADAADLITKMREGVGAAIIAQEAIRGYVEQFTDFLSSQSPWSDIPLIILMLSGRATRESQMEADQLKTLGNVTLIERPVRPETMHSAVQAALRARMRQYEVRQRQRALMQANSDLEQFAHSASHDLKEPIRGIGVYAELLAEKLDGAADSDAQKFLSIIQSSARRMDSLVNALLSYAHASSDVQDSQDRPERVESSRCVEAALENLAGSIRESSAHVLVEDMPVVGMRESHLAQVFQNLIGNAIKYRKEGSEPSVHVSAKREGRFWKFCVSDNGIGIPSEYRNAIFGIFKRLHTSSKYSGAGMGLAICQRIIERYGGTIWVDSEIGSGSTFCFTVPPSESEVQTPEALPV